MTRVLDRWREICLALVVAGIVVVYVLLIPAIHTIGLQQRYIRTQQARQAQSALVTKKQARAACKRTQQIGPGLADLFEVLGREINPKTGKRFLPPGFTATYRASIPKSC